MKIAAIVITYNDDYKFKEWCHWYDEYKDELYKLIIVDNGSEFKYLQQVENFFKDAIIIKRTINGGCTAAYNDGIRYALSQEDITHIALIGNDIRLEKYTLIKCAKILDSDKYLGMIAPVLLEADSSIVANYGCRIGNNLSMIAYDKGKDVSSIEDNFRYCDVVQGGMNIAKRSFYETVGLQDETLFMYSDEVDMALRAKEYRINMAVTREVKTWHQHINPPGNGKRHPYSRFLIARNKVYLGKKHFGRKTQIKIFCHFFVYDLLSIIKDVVLIRWNQIIYPKWAIIGAFYGLIGNMKENKYSKL